MAGTYIIRKLPENSIVEYSKTTKQGKTIPLFKIESDTFPETSVSLQLRPKAALFAKRMSNFPLYLVLCSDQCLFLFTIRSTNTGKNVLDICRCNGKGRSKRYWKTVLEFINKNNESIQKLSNMSYMEMYEDM